MTQNLVRCPVCSQVGDLAAGVCPTCGSALRPVAPPPPSPLPPSYTELYKPFQPAPPPGTVAPPPRPSGRPWTIVAVVVAIAAIVVAAGGSAFVLMNERPTPSPSRAPVAIATPEPTPTPSVSEVPSVIPVLVATLNDPTLSIHLKVSTTYTADARLTPEARSLVIHGDLDAQLSKGNASGVLTAHGVTIEYRIVRGQFYQKVGAKWTTAIVPAATIPTLPLFDIRGPAVLALVGPETVAGVDVIHVRATKAWTGDLNRISLLDTFQAKPEIVTLDIWAKPDGTPVRAALLAATDAADGKRLMTVETTYVFTKPGVAVDITPPPTK